MCTVTNATHKRVLELISPDVIQEYSHEYYNHMQGPSKYRSLQILILRERIKGSALVSALAGKIEA